MSGASNADADASLTDPPAVKKTESEQWPRDDSVEGHMALTGRRCDERDAHAHEAAGGGRRLREGEEGILWKNEADVREIVRIDATRMSLPTPKVSSK